MRIVAVIFLFIVFNSCVDVDRNVDGLFHFNGIENAVNDPFDGLTISYDYDEGLALASRLNRTVMLDFTGWACVNCRKMEQHVRIDSRVHKLLEEDFVIISLYMDDRDQLPETEQYISKITGRDIKTVGERWMDFQQVEFQTTFQPFYVIQDREGNSLGKPIAYTNDKKEYEDWLIQGVLLSKN